MANTIYGDDKIFWFCQLRVNKYQVTKFVEERTVMKTRYQKCHVHLASNAYNCLSVPTDSADSVQ